MDFNIGLIFALIVTIGALPTEIPTLDSITPADVSEKLAGNNSRRQIFFVMHLMCHMWGTTEIYNADVFLVVDIDTTSQYASERPDIDDAISLSEKTDEEELKDYLDTPDESNNRANEDHFESSTDVI